MSKPKDQKESLAPEKESDLHEILSDLYKISDKKSELVEYLEGVPSGSKSSDFYKSYTILLLQKFIENEDDLEMMLAACGLLRGYKFAPKELDKRMANYRKYAQGHNPWIKTGWVASSYATNYRTKLGEIINRLEKILEAKKIENGGTLGIIEEVPKKLKFPKPKYTTNIDELQRPLLPEETITIDMTQESRIEITKILPNGVKRIFHIAKTSATEVKIIALLVLVIAISSFGTVRYVQNYNTQENEKKSGYTAEYSPKIDYAKDRKLTIPKGEPFEVDVATFRTYVQWLNNHPYLKEIRKTIWEILTVKIFWF